MSAILNIYLRTDRDFAESITQYSTYCNCSGTTSPFTGTEYIAQIRPSQNSATLTLALVVDDSQKASGVLNISATAISLASIATGTYYWDLLEVDSTSQKIQLVEGQAFISGTVSREA